MLFKSLLEVVGVARVIFIEGFGVDDVNKPHCDVHLGKNKKGIED